MIYVVIKIYIHGAFSMKIEGLTIKMDNWMIYLLYRQIDDVGSSNYDMPLLNIVIDDNPFNNDTNL